MARSDGPSDAVPPPRQIPRGLTGNYGDQRLRRGRRWAGRCLVGPHRRQRPRRVRSWPEDIRCAYTGSASPGPLPAASMPCKDHAWRPSSRTLVAWGLAVDVIGWTALALFWLVTFVPGIAAICVGWVPPWFRKTVSSPRLGGWADICAGVGGSIIVGPVHRHLESTPMATFATIVGFCFLFSALGLYRRSYRPELSGATAYQYTAAAGFQAGAVQPRDTATTEPTTDTHQPHTPN